MVLQNVQGKMQEKVNLILLQKSSLCIWKGEKKRGRQGEKEGKRGRRTRGKGSGERGGDSQGEEQGKRKKENPLEPLFHSLKCLQQPRQDYSKIKSAELKQVLSCGWPGPTI